MPEPQNDPDPAGTKNNPPSDTDDKFKPITSQDDLDRIMGERVRRERAKFADYDDLKSKADKFDKLEAENKSDLEKAQDDIKAARAERDAAIFDRLRFQTAAKHGISDDDAEKFLTGTDAETLESQAARLAELAAERKRGGTRSPKEGRTLSEHSDNLRDLTRKLFAG